MLKDFAEDTAICASSLGLYIHVPFCSKICPYCDFNVYALKKIPEDLFVKSVLSEIQGYTLARPLQNRNLTTIYFGGGTPSILSASSIEKITQHIFNYFKPSSKVEITIEANPQDLNAELLKSYKDLNFTRISLGVQSTIETKLKKLGRSHTSKDIYNCINLLRKENFDNINLDLIFGAPEESLAILELDLKNYLELNPEHISPYGLTIEKGTPFFKAQQLGSLKVPDEEVSAEMFLMVKETLSEKANYLHYEISNFAKAGFESEHNLACWNFEDYLGFGPGAHSSINTYNADQSLKTRYRWANIANYKTYFDKFNKLAWHEILPPEKAQKEFILTNLRKSSGIDFKKYYRIFQKDFVKCHDVPITWLSSQGLINLKQDRLTLSIRGQLLADSVIQEFFAGV